MHLNDFQPRGRKGWVYDGGMGSAPRPAHYFPA